MIGATARGAEVEARWTANGCTPDTARCPDAKRSSVETPACCRGWIAQLLREVGAALDEAGVPWCIDYGALLGYMTNGGLYWNDADTDLCAMVDGRERIASALMPLALAGRTVEYLPAAAGTRKYGDAFKIRLSAVNHTNCDITLWTLGPDGMLDRESYIRVDDYKGRAFPAAWAFPATRGLWEGVEVNVPAKPLRLVAHRYGENWRNLPAARTDGVRRLPTGEPMSDEDRRKRLAQSGYILPGSAFEAKAATGPTENKAAAGPPENKAQDLSALTVAELRKRAEAAGVEVQGTGSGGSVVKADLLKALGG